MNRSRRTSSWNSHRTRRHAAHALVPIPPPTPTPVPDDDDDFDWPGADDLAGNDISSDHAYVYAIAQEGECYTALMGQRNDTEFRNLVSRAVDSPVKQVVTRVYADAAPAGPGGEVQTWCLNPKQPGHPSARRFGAYVIDHVFYALLDGKTAQEWLTEKYKATGQNKGIHGKGLNTNKDFFDLLSFQSPPSPSPGPGHYSASGVVRARKKAGGTQLQWKSLKVTLVGTAGNGLPPNDGARRHFCATELAVKVAETSDHVDYSFGGTTPLLAVETNGHPMTGAFLVAYGIYEVRGPAGPEEYFAVSAPENCEHPREFGNP